MTKQHQVSKKYHNAGEGFNPILNSDQITGRHRCDTRICFGIAWYEKEEDAIKADKETRARGNYYNGGWNHGRPCGRDESWDYLDKDDGAKFYAVTY